MRRTPPDVVRRLIICKHDALRGTCFCYCDIARCITVRFPARFLYPRVIGEVAFHAISISVHLRNCLQHDSRKFWLVGTLPDYIIIVLVKFFI